MNDTSEPLSAATKAEAVKKIDSLNMDLQTLALDTNHFDQLYFYRKGHSTTTIFNKSYKNYEEYDSLQKRLPEDRRDGFIKRRIAKRTFEITAETQKGNFSLLNEFIEKFVHRIPQLLFISLPFFALILQLLYRRQRRLYVEHTIFTVHLYCAYFILFFFFMLVLQLQHTQYLHWLDYLFWPFVAVMYFYQYKAMRTFYGQGRMKTIVKQIIQNMVAFFVMLFLAILVFFISAIFI